LVFFVFLVFFGFFGFFGFLVFVALFIDLLTDKVTPISRDDYILHVHPDTQRMPSAERLRRWYHTMIDEGTKTGLVLEKTSLYHEHLQYHFLTSRERAKIKQRKARSKATKGAKRAKLM
jgi:hypothetical protein